MTTSNKVVAAFSEEHTERLTGISRSQLQYWDRTNFYQPSLAEGNRRLAFSRIYSFKDIVALRVLNVLRNQYSVPLQHLRTISAKLSRSQEGRWTGVRLWVINKKVVWTDPKTDLPQEILSKQYVLPTLDLDTVMVDTKRDLKKLNTREKTQIGVVEKSRFVLQNTTVLAGTRIPVEAIKKFHQAGYSVAEIIKEYPDLTAKDVKAVLKPGNNKTAA